MTLRVKVKPGYDDPIVLTVDGSGRLPDLKSAVEAATGIPPDDQKLILGTQTLSDAIVPLSALLGGDCCLYMVPVAKGAREQEDDDEGKEELREWV